MLLYVFQVQILMPGNPTLQSQDDSLLWEARKGEGVGAIGMETKELPTVFEVCFLSLKISESDIESF